MPYLEGVRIHIFLILELCLWMLTRVAKLANTSPTLIINAPRKVTSLRLFTLAIRGFMKILPLHVSPAPIDPINDTSASCP